MGEPVSVFPEAAAAPATAPATTPAAAPAGVPAEASATPVTQRAFDDVAATRQAIFDNVMTAFQKKYPLSNDRYTLKLSGLKYRAPKQFSIAEQKTAIMRGRTIGWNLTGAWELLDNKTGALVDRTKQQLIAQVPYMTNRGTFIYNGNEYAIAGQMRLRPGIYSRVKDNGLIEAHFNVKGGSGPSFRVHMEPDTGIFRMNVGQANLKLYPILKSMGFSDRQLLAAWGRDLLYANIAATDSRAVQRAVAKLVKPTAEPPELEKAAQVAAKQPKHTVNYVQLGTLQQCMQCEHFNGLNECRQVQGFIAPTGWCVLWSAAFGKSAQEQHRVRAKFVGKLVCDDSKPGKPWVYLKIHKGLPEAAFEALKDQGIECEAKFDLPHISVLRNWEAQELVKKYGRGWKKACCDGRIFPFSLQNAMVDLEPEGWTDMDRVWFLEAKSPELRAYRKSMQLDELPHGDESDDEFQFHITVAVLKKAKTPRGRSSLDGLFDGTEDKTKAAFVQLAGMVKEARKRRTTRKKKKSDHIALPFELGTSNKPEKVIEDTEGTAKSDPLAYSVLDIVSKLAAAIDTSDSADETSADLYEIQEQAAQDIAGSPAALAAKLQQRRALQESQNIAAAAQATEDTTEGKALTRKQVLTGPLTKLPQPPELPAKIAYAALVGRNGMIKRADEDYGPQLRSVFEKMELDPTTTEQTLGRRVSNVSPDLIVDITKRLISINKKEAGTDDRDALAYQHVMGPEDFFAERISQDAGGLGRRLLWRATFKGDVGKVYPGALSPQLRSVLLKSGLASPLEEVNPLEILDQLVRVTRMGEGGMSSDDAVPDEARGVQPSHFGLIDPIRAPEGMKIGVDSRIAHRTYKGSDGKLYSDMLNARTGQPQRIDVQQLAKSVVAFPGELAKEGNQIRAMINGKRLAYVDRSEVDYALPHTSHMFTATSNMVPMVSSIKGGRLLMASKMGTQALPLQDAEAPLVQNLSDDQQRSFEEIYGEKVGAVRARGPGAVEEVTKNHIKVRYADGKIEKHELYHTFPFNVKTFLHNSPAVKVGDQVKAGTLLAKSNYTDNEGSVALGKNLRVAYMAYRGFNADDAIVISEKAAKSLSSEHMYTTKFKIADNQEVSKRAFLSLYPGRFDKKQMSTIDDNGVVKPGTVVQYGDPLVLAVDKRKPTGRGVLRGRKMLYSDVADTWEHASPGTVTDVDRMKGGWKVLTRAYSPMNVGDKLCYDDETEVLTLDGWKLFSQLTFDDLIASLDPSTGALEYTHPLKLYRFRHCGRMYKLCSQQLDMLVTENHRMFVQMRYHNSFELVEATNVFGKRVSYKKNAIWSRDDSPRYKTLPAMRVRAGQGGVGVAWLPELAVPIELYAALLGAYVSEGSVVWQPSSGSYGIDICQKKPRTRKRLVELLKKYDINWSPTGDKLRIYGKQLAAHFKTVVGTSCYSKRLPSEVFGWSSSLQRVVFDWLMWGDGHTKSGKPIVYTTTSKRLADDVQQLLLHIGYAGNIKTRDACEVEIFGRRLWAHARYDVRIITTKLTPTVNHGHVCKQHAQTEAWVDYDGDVWCCELPCNHVLYVRRGGKPVWSGNSNRYGGKGVVSLILPDDQMPHDKDGGAMDILLNPLGVVSRGNPAQLVETVLGKVAKKTGKPYKIPGFMDGSYVDFAKHELQRAGLSDTEDLYDPKSGRKISQVFTGHTYIMKLHHMAEPKASGRDVGAYTSEGIPAGGGQTGSKRIGSGEMNALVSHGATNVIRDAQVVRGQKNDDYWRALRLGYAPPSPKVPVVYEKFLAHLQGAGINLKKKGDVLHLFAGTDADTAEMSSGPITKAQTVTGDKMDPVEGGLFDVGKTGGHGGSRFSHIQLATFMPSPIMEEPIRRILGLTKKMFEDTIAGTHKIETGTGTKAIHAALERVNVDSAIKVAQEAFREGPASKRDEAVKLLGYLQTLKKANIKPSALMLRKVPVIPPNFRPITATNKLKMEADANALYVDLMNANSAYQDLHADLGEEHTGDERLQLYKAFKAVTGLGDPISVKLQQRGVRGLLKHVFGDSPKGGMYQRRVLGAAVDTVGRGVITPNPSLTMDQIGLPENKAWILYRPFIMRHLVRRGMGAMAAAKSIENKGDVARKALIDEMARRPVIINRAPVLHRYGMMAAWPILTKGNTLQIPPIVTAGFNADFNGDSSVVSRVYLRVDGVIHVGNFEEFMQLFIDGTYSEQTAVERFGRVTHIMPIRPDVRVETLGIAPDGTAAWVPVSHISIHMSHGPRCFRAISKSGLDAVFTAHHNAWKLNERCELVSAKTETLVSGALIPCAFGVAIPADLDGVLGVTPLPVAPTFDNGVWFGHYLADGSLTGHADTVSQAGTDAKLLKYLARIGDTFMGCKHWYEGNHYSVRWTNKVWVQFLLSTTGKGAAGKHVASWMLSMGRQFQLGIIVGYLAGEGNVSGSCIRVECVNRELLLDIRFILMSLGVWSSVRPGKAATSRTLATYILRINASELEALHIKWPPILRLKRFADISTSKKWHSSDRVPLPAELRPLLRRQGKRYEGGGRRRADRQAVVPDYKQLHSSFARGYCPRSFARAVVAGYGLRACDDAVIKNWVNLVDNESIRWDIIESIQPVERPAVTYDLSVPGREAFSIDGTFLTHNTMSFHVPVSEDAVQDAVNKMMPSRNLQSVTDFDVHYYPRQEFLHGLHLASTAKKKGVKTFLSRASVLAAYKRGELDVGDQIHISRP